ncbi:C45 family peptidase [Capnocytophaga sp.]|uniref:C45 family peptidase n=1 Tax=Capnocytophaga sp. TaxID=44737 RepID=UPI0026DD0583|nr:C45 family peptidase [Capnocytophaga sp.]MDO5105316.1 C45 family peptidase [Capnocytophaga sp.]
MKYSFVFFFLIFASCGVSKKKMLPPEIDNQAYSLPKVTLLADTLLYTENDYLLKNKFGIWEVYLSGKPYAMGLKSGALTQKLYQRQDSLFFEKVKTFISSEKKIRFLHKFIRWFNRDVNKYVIKPFREELLGQSMYSDSVYDFVASKYERSLYLHSAHDIGHALQDLMLVGCSSLAVWGQESEDGQLLIGRNFDFYLSDDFAREKIIRFVQPDSGIPFMSYAWGGMVGVFSGMNLDGLTVSINAGKSNLPMKAKTPISLVSREILQYASTIGEAIAIAKKKEVFVSESILVGSAKDNKAVIIEMSPKKMDVYELKNTSRLICTNHFQGKVYQSDKNNQKQIKKTHTSYRFDKIQELMNVEKRLNPEKMAKILRNTEGLDGKKLGYGNEKALNQLLAHHSVIFQPEKKLVWISTNPYQLGEFIAYDLNEIFKKSRKKEFSSMLIDSLTISKSNFLKTKAYQDYESYRKLENKFENDLKQKITTPEAEMTLLCQLNPDYWKAYYLCGKIYYEQKKYHLAKTFFEKSLQKEIPYEKNKEMMVKYIRKCARKLKK